VSGVIDKFKWSKLAMENVVRFTDDPIQYAVGDFVAVKDHGGRY
jgi:hypothetical protein